MNAQRVHSWGPIVTAFTVWFVHFMMCWTAAEIWPYKWTANAVAWGITGMALLALAWHVVRVNNQHARGTLPGWNHRFAQGAVVIAAAAVLFSAVASIVFLP